MAKAGADVRTNGGRPREPEQIEREIEQAREDLAETLAAVAEKANVKKQARAKVDETKARATERVDAAKRNPLPIAVGAALILGGIGALIALRNRRRRPWHERMANSVSKRIPDPPSMPAMPEMPDRPKLPNAPRLGRRRKRRLPGR